MERIMPVRAGRTTDDARLKAFVAELGLKPGQTVEARVAAMISDGLARLIIAGRPLDVQTPQPLPVGQTLTLTVERQGQMLRLLLGALPSEDGAPPARTTLPSGASPPATMAGRVPLPLPGTPGMPAAGQGPAGQPAAGQAPVAQAAPAGAVPVPAATLPGPAPSIPGTVQAATPATGALPGPPAGTPVAGMAASPSPGPAAATGQNAPAPAPPAAALAPAAGAPARPAPPAMPVAPAVPASSGIPASPPAVPQAAVTGAAGAVAAMLAMAARETGHLRAGMDGAQVATAARGSPDAARLAGLHERADRPEETQRALLGTAVRQAAGRQESLAPLFADLSALAGGRAPQAMPDPVLRAMAAVLGFRVPVEAATSPQGLARAVAGSGTFLEARLAALPAGATPPPDLKAALAGLRDALADWRTTLPSAPSGDGAEGQAAARTGAHARPPLRGGLPEGQMPAAPTIGAHASPGEVALVLAERTESALARILLLQAASLPDGREAARPDAPVQTSVEVPLRLGQETAIVQMLISRDPHDEEEAKEGAAQGRSWTLRFSMDAEPLGPVHASVRWQAGHVAVRLWAEREGTADRLAAAREGLSDALEASAFAIDDLTIAAGRPTDPARPQRPPRLDRLS